MSDDLRIRIIARELLIDALRDLGQMQPLLPVDFRFLASRLANQQHSDQTELEKRDADRSPSVLDEMMAKLESRPDAVQPAELTQELVDALCSDDD